MSMSDGDESLANLRSLIDVVDRELASAAPTRSRLAPAANS
jgi:hypothetical protein